MTPSFISAARTLRPVGLIRSPMMTKGLSPEITTSRPREARRVSKNLTLAERLVDFHDGLLQSLRARRAFAPIADELLRHPRRHGCVGRVAVGPDALCVFLGHRLAADRDEPLGAEEVALLESPPHLLEGGDQGLEEDVHGAHAEPQALFSQRLHLGSVAVEGVLEKAGSDLFFAAHQAVSRRIVRPRRVACNG